MPPQEREDEPQYSSLSIHLGFCISGVIQVIGMQWEDYHGLGGNSQVPLSRTTALPVLPTELGARLPVMGSPGCVHTLTPVTVLT